MRSFTFRDPAFLRKVSTGGGGGGGGGSTVLLADLTALWRLNEALAADDAVDAASGGHDLTLNTGSAAPITGKIAGGRETTGDDYFRSAADMPAFHLAVSNSWSVFWWLKVVDWGTSNTFWPFEHGVPALPEFRLRLLEGTPDQIELIAPGIVVPDDFLVGAGDLTAWTFFAGGFDAATSRFWMSVDAAARTWKNANMGFYAPPATGNDKIKLGQLTGSVKDGDLDLDSVGWLKAKLTDTQIAWLYNAGAGRDITA